MSQVSLPIRTPFITLMANIIEHVSRVFTKNYDLFIQNVFLLQQSPTRVYSSTS